VVPAIGAVPSRLATDTIRLVTLDETLAAFLSAAGAFARGQPEPVKALYSRAQDVTIANPFGPAVRGWENVSAALDFAASRFSEGEVSAFDNLARYEAPGLVTLIGTEHWHTRIGGEEHVDFDLRVTSTYREEKGEWKLVHRHADPISSFDADGPVRSNP
jgi:ketosteroid isomerase-like protein